MIISGTGSFLTKIHAQGFPVTPVTLHCDALVAEIYVHTRAWHANLRADLSKRTRAC